MQINIKGWPNFHTDWPQQSILSRLPEPVIERWINTGEFRQFNDKDVLIREGSHDSCVLLLLSGCVKVITEVQDNEVLLAVRVGGDLVSEFAALDHGARSASVVACGHRPVLACSIDYHQFRSALDEEEGDVAREIAASIVTKLRSATRRRGDLLKEPRIRLANLIVDLTDDYGHSTSPGTYVIKVNLTQSEFGALIGVSEATAHRAMRHLRLQGWVEVTGRRLIVKDLNALRNFTSNAK